MIQKSRILQCGEFELSLSRPLIMGIVNVTPDSFSDGGKYHDTARAIEHAHELIVQWADILDIWGESTRPWATPVLLQEELERIIPVIEWLRDCGIPISVDTYKPEVMDRALAAWANMINDVRALQEVWAIEIIQKYASLRPWICLMHTGSFKDPREVYEFLAGRIEFCIQHGISADQLVIDPGYGFGKSTESNIQLARAQDSLCSLDIPILVGWSRKRTIGQITDQENPEDRIHGSIAAALASIQKGANIVRVHDVRAMRDALRVWVVMTRKT